MKLSDDLNLNLKEKILIYFGDEHTHLKIGEKKSKDQIEQLSRILGVEEKRILDELERLENKEMVSKYKLKSDDTETESYRITEDGKKKENELWKNFGDNKIMLTDEKDVITLKLREVKEVLKGISILKIFEMTAEDGVIDLRESKRKTEKLVGREKEIEKLNEDVKNLKNNIGNMVLISGSTGMGKTRLGEELKSICKEEGIDFLKGECYPEDYTPYAPFEKTLEKFLRCNKHFEEDGEKISPYESPEGRVHNQEMFYTQRESIFYNTTNFLKNISQKRPKILLLDDLQWADKGTLNLLDYMADKLKNHPVLMIGTYRPGDISEKHPLKKTIRKMSRKKSFDKIQLSPLKKEAVIELISNITSVPEDKIPKNFIDDIHNKTDSNPLFIIESINQMIKEGKIDIRKPQFPTTPKLHHIPDIVQEVVKKRVYELSDESREVLQLGSTIGKKIPFDLLHEALDYDELELLEKIDGILESEIWREHPREESFFFSHDFFVDTIYEGIGKWLEKKRYHKKVAEAMEKIYENQLEDNYSSLGHHFLKGEIFDKALEYFFKAGLKAESVYAHEDAIERYEEALKISKKYESVEIDNIVDLLERLGETNKMIGNYEKCRKYLSQALNKTEKPLDQRRLYRKMAESWRTEGNFDKTIETVKEAVELSSGKEILAGKEKEMANEQITSEDCELLSIQGWALMRKGKYDKAKQIFNKELETARELGDNSLMAKAYHDLGSTERGGLSSDQCIEYLKKSIELRKKVSEKKESFKNRCELFRSRNNLGAMYLQSGDLKQAENEFTEALKLNRKIKNKMFETLALNNLAAIKIQKGELSKACSALEKVSEIVEGIMYRQGHFLLENTKGHFHKEKGELDLALEHFEKGLEVAQDMDFKFGITNSYVNITKVFLLKGDIKKSSQEIEKAHEIAEDLQINQFLVKTLMMEGKIKRLSGELDKSIEIHDKAIKLSQKTSEKVDIFENRCELIEDLLAKGDIESAEHHLEKARDENLCMPNTSNKLDFIYGKLLLKKGDIAKSEKIFKRCLQNVEELGKRYRIAQVYYELGKLKNLDGKDQKAIECFQKARELSEKMGMNLLLEEAEIELNNLS